MPTLLPLRVSSRWAVVHNNLVDLAYEDASEDERDAYFAQDLLSIALMELGDDGWVCSADSVTIDVGWYATGGGVGEYRLSVVQGDWDKPLVSVAYSDRRLLGRGIEICMEWLATGIPAERVQDHLDLLFG